MRTSLKPERNPDQYQKIMGVDSSTLGVAYTQFEAGRPGQAGMIKLSQIKDMQDKLGELSRCFLTLLDSLRPDHIFVEMPIFVKNPDTARKLSFVVGAIMTIAAQEGYKVTLVEPATWKAYIGYHNITRKFTTEATQKLGKTEAKKLCDGLRKSQTQRILTHRWPEFDASDDNIADSCAIAAYGVNLLSTQMLFEKNKEIAFDLKDLASKGLSF